MKINNQRAGMDELWIEQASKGNLEAFNQLVLRWQDRLWRHARRLIRDDTEAWDVLQEAWMGIIKGLRRLDDPGLLPGGRAGGMRLVSHRRSAYTRIGCGVAPPRSVPT